MFIFTKAAVCAAAVFCIGAMVSYGQDQAKDTTMPMHMNMPAGHMSMKAHHQGNDSAMSMRETKRKATPVKKQKLAPQTTCPVRGDPINKDVYVDYKGKRVYFCCAGCPNVFNKDPEKYLKILADRGEAPIDIPKK